MSKYTHTNNAFAKLRELSPDEINAYNEASAHEKLLDSYGGKTTKVNLCLYQKYRRSSSDLNRFYLLPYKRLETANMPSLNEFAYNGFKTENDGICEFINVTTYSNDEMHLVHISDFMQCSVSGKYGSYHNMVQLSHQWYSNREFVMDNVVYQANYHETCFLKKDDAVKPFGSYRYFHKDDTDSLVWSDHHEAYLYTEDAVYPEDNCDTAYHVDYVYYSERDDLYYTTREMATNDTIRDYHCTPTGTYYLKGDINDPKDVLANYTVGFEIEKYSIDGYRDEGDPHSPEALFVGWETDSSCGVEGITNIYSLNNSEVFNNHVNSSYYINEETTQKCGGHINISDQTNRIRFWHIKNWLGLWYAMFRKRLNNEYASSNKKACPYIAKSGPKYQAIREKNLSSGRTIYELRLPSRVKNHHQLIRRFRLCQKWMQCIHAYANEDWSYTTAKYDDIHWGMPNWALDNTRGVTELRLDDYSIQAKLVAKDTAELISKHVSKPTALRMRYLIEQSKDELLESYAFAGDLSQVIKLAYAFQAYCEIPNTETTPRELMEYIEAYI
jgi:hypothetical protein